MKVYQINIFGNLSTGRIATDLCEVLKKNGHESKLAFARNETLPNISHYIIGNKFDVMFHGFMTRLTDRQGFFSKTATKGLIEDVKAYNPDIIHLHNLHGYYINIEMLFDFLSASKIPVIWTLHDCWAYTGHCCHYSACGCEKWKTGCHDCPNLCSYPASYYDGSARNYRDKKRLFTSIEGMHIVTVSHWLENQVNESFLKNCSITTIYNGIDFDIFKPTSSNIRDKLGLNGKRIILGVASTWHKNKGLDDFIALSKLIPDGYVILLVGLSTKQLKNLPSNVVGLPRTESVEELVEIYSAADVFVNASIEETFGLPTVEAMACGTPSIVYNCTALPEVCEGGTGYIVEPHDLNRILEITQDVCNSDIRTSEIVASVEKYDKWAQYMKYIELYEKIL